VPQQAIAGNGTILDLGLPHRPHPHRLRIALGVEEEQRAAKMLVGVKGKRLTYRTTGS